MTSQVKRCPFRYYNNFANTSAMWDNRCKLEEGHKGEHIQGGLIVPQASQTNTFTKTGWVKE